MIKPRKSDNQIITFSMESALALVHLPQKLKQNNPSFLVPYSYNPIRRSKHHLLTANPISTGRSSIPMIKSSENLDGKKLYVPVKAVTGATLALACALSIFGLKIMNPKPCAGKIPIVHQKETKPKSTIMPQGGRTALRSLLRVTAILGSRYPIEDYKQFDPNNLPQRPSERDVDAMKMQAVRLMKSGQSKEAVDFLSKKYEQYKDDPEPAYNVQMALVEILVCQGRFEDANKCKCLREDERSRSAPSDVRPVLYKAIICTMLNRHKEARRWWKQFSETIGEGAEDAIKTSKID